MPKKKEDVLINSRSTDWTEEEVALAVAALTKIRHSQDMRQGMPGEVFEAHVRSKKNISTELGLFNAEGRLYLSRRPSKEENPSEPYPGQLHMPGVTHMQWEMLPDTHERLRKREGIDFLPPLHVKDHEGEDKERGVYECKIHVALALGDPTNPQGRFFPPAEIPWDELVGSHRDIMVPTVLEAYQRTWG